MKARTKDRHPTKDRNPRRRKDRQGERRSVSRDAGSLREREREREEKGKKSLGEREFSESFLPRVTDGL
mgnify:CR=1 FL=1